MSIGYDTALPATLSNHLRYNTTVTPAVLVLQLAFFDILKVIILFDSTIFYTLANYLKNVLALPNITIN